MPSGWSRPAKGARERLAGVEHRASLQRPVALTGSQREPGQPFPCAGAAFAVPTVGPPPENPLSTGEPYTRGSFETSGALCFRLVSPYWRCRRCPGTDGRAGPTDCAFVSNRSARPLLTRTASTASRPVVWNHVEASAPSAIFPQAVHILCNLLRTPHPLAFPAFPTFPHPPQPLRTATK